MKQPLFLASTDANALNTLNTYVERLLICLNYPTDTFSDSYTLPYIDGISISPSGLSFILRASNPVTYDLYERSVHISGNTYDDGVVKARVVYPNSGTFSYGSTKVYLSPCVVMFLNNNTTMQDTLITIATNTPLRTELESNTNTVKITADTDNINSISVLTPPDQKAGGIKAINGVQPTTGDVRITGIGDTVINVSPYRANNGV